MKEYIRSGGDITVVVASDKDVKVQPVREAFQKVLGRATIYGIPTKVGNHSHFVLGWNILLNSYHFCTII